MGMGPMLVLLQRSLDKGKHLEMVQFLMTWKMRSAFSNIYHDLVKRQHGVVLAKDTQEMAITDCPAFGDWHEKFVKGAHKCMGDVMSEGSPNEKFWVALEGAFYLIKEVPMVDILGVNKYWEAGAHSEKPHMVITLLGRFKRGD